MSDKQLFEHLLNGDYLSQRPCRNKRYGYCLYTGNASIVSLVTIKQYERIEPLLKESKKRFTLNLSIVRQQHGKSIVKKLYKKKPIMNEIDKVKQKLSKYGQVSTCKIVHPDVVTICIRKGFSINANNTFSFMLDCHKSFPNHPILDTCITDTDFALIILKTES